MTLTKDQYLRYSRHLILPEVGLRGQKRLLESKVLIIGAGGLGCPIAQYLAAVGVGTIGLVDFDRVDESNLQRQVLFTTHDVGRLKVEVAAERLRAMNPDVQVRTYPVRITSENALDIMKDYDVIIDGTDNFPTRYLTNDASVFLGKPYIYGSIFRFEGQVTVFKPKEGPCYRCLFPEPPPPGLVPSCAEGGVLGVLPGVIGLIQATEAIKLIVGTGEPLIGRLLLYDALDMSFRTVRIRRNPDCVVCGDRPTVTQLIDYEAFCGVRPDVNEAAYADIQVNPVDVKLRLEQGDDLILIDVREPFEYEIARIEGARLIPLTEFVLRLPELEPYKDKEIVVYCHRGGRSLMAAQILLARGFQKVRSMYGGIDAWAEQVDPQMPRY